MVFPRTGGERTDFFSFYGARKYSKAPYPDGLCCHQRDNTIRGFLTHGSLTHYIREYAYTTNTEALKQSKENTKGQKGKGEYIHSTDSGVWFTYRIPLQENSLKKRKYLKKTTHVDETH